VKRALVVILVLVTCGLPLRADDTGQSPASGTRAAAIPAAVRRAIQRAVMAHLESIRLMAGVTVEVEALHGAFARARSVPPRGMADPAWVFVQKTKGRWAVVLGPGTAFDVADYEAHHIPAALRR
jgi:hypothetical protein